MAAPLWLLDFDGVVNAISKRGAKSVWDRWASDRIPHPDPDEGMDGVTLPILWSPYVIDAINYAVDRGIDVRWLTTWREHTAILPDVIGDLPVLPWMDEDTLSAAGGMVDVLNQLGQRWKLDVFLGVVPDDVPVLWTDDHLDAILYRAADKHLVTSRKGGTTLIAPRETIGLSQRQVREIREWVDDHAVLSGG